MSVERDLLTVHSEALSWFSRSIIDPVQRRNLALWLHKRLNVALGNPDQLRPDVAFGGADELRDLGLKFIDVGLTAEVLADIRSRLDHPPEHPDQRYVLPLADVLAAPRLLEIATSEDVLSVVADYLGTYPLLSDFSAWWTLGGDGKGDQVFHRDQLSVKFCKLFIYLTDVEELDGPHQFAMGSQKIEHVKARLESNPQGSMEILKRMFAHNGYDEHVTTFLAQDLTSIVGEAGTTFLEDTYGIHRAIVPAPGRKRLIFSAYYSASLEAGQLNPIRAIPGWQNRVTNTPLAQYAMSHWLN